MGVNKTQTRLTGRKKKDISVKTETKHLFPNWSRDSTLDFSFSF